MELRGYQERAVEAVVAEVRAGRRRVVICAPCGSGKSAKGAELARRARAKGRRVVWLAHRQELCDQARATLTRIGADGVQVHTVQSLLARGEAPEADVVIADEAHHLVSDRWSALLAAYSKAVIVGLTATPERADGRGLAPAFEVIVVAAQISELVALGHLVPCEVIRPKRALRAGQIAQSPAVAYTRHAAGSRCIVFAPHLKAAREYAAEFSGADVVDGKMGDMTRYEIMRRFRDGDVPVLVNVGIATEGVDVPETEVVIVARGCGSVGLWIQMCGRAMRPAAGKARALVIDLRGCSYELGRPDADREYSLSGVGISGGTQVAAQERLCRLCQAALGDEAVCPRCGEDNVAAMPVVVGEELDKWEFKRGESVDGKVAQLARWMAKWPGQNPRALGHRFKAVYGSWPEAEMFIAARKIDGERKAG